MKPKQRIIRIPMLPSQRKFLESACPVKGFSGPVGSGKTYALAYQVLRSAADNPGCTGLLGAPTQDMLEAATLPVLQEVLERHNIAHVYRKSQNLVTITPNRADYQFAKTETTVMFSVSQFFHLRPRRSLVRLVENAADC